MAAEPINTEPGTDATNLAMRISCPYCDQRLVWENGVRRGSDGICTEALVIVRCARHGLFEIMVKMTRSDVRNPRLSGAQQRRQSRERQLMMAGGQ